MSKPNATKATNKSDSISTTPPGSTGAVDGVDKKRDSISSATEPVIISPEQVPEIVCITPKGTKIPKGLMDVFNNNGYGLYVERAYNDELELATLDGSDNYCLDNITIRYNNYAN